MEKDPLQQHIVDLIDKTQWTEFLMRFIEVLRVNVFVVSFDGRMVVWPYADGERHRYGNNLLTASFRFDLTGQKNMLKDFYLHGQYLEYKDPFEFYAFAIPIKVEGENPFAYLIVGPVILNKRWSGDDYINLANQLGFQIDDLIDSIQEIRVVSFVTIKTILDLLSEVTKDIVELNLEKKRLHQQSLPERALPQSVSDAASDMYTTIHRDELLVTILDVAINLSKAEGGSIMVYDEEQGCLTIKVSRGLDSERARNARLKIGEGIAGLAAQENRSFVIGAPAAPDNRIAHLLKRPEIKQSVVVPLASDQKVFGVLNLHTKNATAPLDTDQGNIQYLSRLISTAIHSI